MYPYHIMFISPTCVHASLVSIQCHHPCHTNYIPVLTTNIFLIVKQDKTVKIEMDRNIIGLLEHKIYHLSVPSSSWQAWVSWLHNAHYWIHLCPQRPRCIFLFQPSEQPRNHPDHWMKKNWIICQLLWPFTNSSIRNHLTNILQHVRY